MSTVNWTNGCDVRSGESDRGVVVGDCLIIELRLVRMFGIQMEGRDGQDDVQDWMRLSAFPLDRTTALTFMCNQQFVECRL
jgi:hypothetical protein